MKDTTANRILFPDYFAKLGTKPAPQSKRAAPAKAPSGAAPADSETMQAVGLHGNRETWLRAAVAELAPIFAARAGDKDPRARIMPPVKVSCGFPATGGKGKRKQTIGECWPRARSADGSNQVFVSPVLSDPIKVLDVLVHELCHAVDDCQNGHKAPFATLARAMLLEGRITSTEGGEEFKREIAAPVIAKLGKYPHAGLDVTAKTKPTQATRMLKACCAGCGYSVRVSRKWLDVATPTCPDSDCEKFGVEMDVDMGAFENDD